MKKNLLHFIVFSMLCIVSCKDDTPVKSCSAKPTVSAGDDQILVDATTATLNGTTSETKGTWSILEGQGGEIRSGSPVVFAGKLKYTYKLKWESTNDCGTSSDEVVITFNANCGATQTVTKMAENMHWIQQSCFRIEGSSYTIYTDPNSITQKDTADLILISHPHGDHYSAENLDKITGPNTIIIAPQDVVYSGTFGKRVNLTPGQEYEAFGCIKIKAVPAYNITKTSFHAKSANWVGYLITINGVTIYHAGDTELIPEMKDFTCDIALLSLGQTYTFNTVEDAAQAAKDVKAKLAIPMHFGLYEGTEANAVTFKNLLTGVIPVVIKAKGQ